MELVISGIHCSCWYAGLERLSPRSQRREKVNPGSPLNIEADSADLNLYVISPDRKTLHRFTNHKDIDMHPKLLNDGRVAYLR
ncbi:MAG: hypothetical protein LBC74_05515 [Planctomycetaceae bacterium]|nr:hypothetical protein [Planctomycetaceae bacterium]